jgi:hypothetical protein
MFSYGKLLNIQVNQSDQTESIKLDQSNQINSKSNQIDQISQIKSDQINSKQITQTPSMNSYRQPDQLVVGRTRL